MKYCIICGEVIPDGRVKAIPNVETHSDAKRKKGFSVISSKTTYSELDIVDEKTFKKLKKLDRNGWHATN